jgi:NADH dehydrogenase
MRIAVTGGKGFIGWHLTQRLVADGHQVVLLARKTSSGHSASRGLAADFIASDLSDPEILIHMLDHLSHAVHTLPLFARVGLKEKRIRPLAVEDLIEVLSAALVENRLSRKTIAITGAEELYLSEAARRVARIAGKRLWIVPAPIWFHYGLAWLSEWTMKVPLVARAQVRILSEGVVEPALPCDPLPADLSPKHRFTDEQIRTGLPARGPFKPQDLRCCA